MKYQIFGPNGNKVCIVEAGLVCFTDNKTLFYESKPQEIEKEKIFGVPDQLIDVIPSIMTPKRWVVIPLEFIDNDNPEIPQKDLTEDEMRIMEEMNELIREDKTPRKDSKRFGNFSGSTRKY